MKSILNVICMSLENCNAEVCGYMEHLVIWMQNILLLLPIVKTAPGHNVIFYYRNTTEYVAYVGMNLGKMQSSVTTVARKSNDDLKEEKGK